MPQFPYRLVFFDLDGTLTPSKQAMPEYMADMVRQLLGQCPVAIISGGQFSQFEKQFITPLGEANLAWLHLLPTCGTQYFRYQAEGWHCLYRQDLEPGLVAKARQVLRQVCQELGFWSSEHYGERIEDRGSQLTFSALGQDAPLDKKALWDPSGDKRREIAKRAGELLPELSVRSGGSTSIDLTQWGVDKAYGIRRLLDSLQIEPGKALFIGDRLDPQGNDYPATFTGVNTLSTTGPEQTCELVKQLLVSG